MRAEANELGVEGEEDDEFATPLETPGDSDIEIDHNDIEAELARDLAELEQLEAEEQSLLA
jgi:hypothetical protein